jgi:hypothetical protein
MTELPTETEIEDEESGWNDPVLVELDRQVPENEDEDEDLSDRRDAIDEADLKAEKYDPVNDGDDSVLAEVVKEKLNG